MHLKWLTISHSSKLTRSYFELNHRHTCPSVDLNYQFLSQARQSIVAFNTNHIIAICQSIVAFNTSMVAFNIISLLYVMTSLSLTNLYMEPVFSRGSM